MGISFYRWKQLYGGLLPPREFRIINPKSAFNPP